MLLQDILNFITIEKSGSISLAADNLFLSQSSLTKSLQRLESELGVRLIERYPGKREITLTPSGKLFLLSAHKIKQNLTEIEDNFLKKQNNYTILSSNPIYAYVVPGLINSSAPVNFRILTDEDPFNSKQTFDIAIIEANSPYNFRRHSYLLLKDRNYLCGASSNKKFLNCKSINKLDNMNFITLNQKSAQARMVHKFLKKNNLRKAEQNVIVVEDLQTLKTTIANSDNITILPFLFLGPRTDTVLRSCDSLDKYSYFYALFNRDNKVPESELEVIHFLKNLVNHTKEHAQVNSFPKILSEIN